VASEAVCERQGEAELDIPSCRTNLVSVEAYDGSARFESGRDVDTRLGQHEADLWVVQSASATTQAATNYNSTSRMTTQA